MKAESINEHCERWGQAVEARAEWSYNYYLNLRYAAGKTLTYDEIAILQSQGRDIPNYNIIDGNLRLIEGMEAQNRSDIKGLPRTPADTESAEAVSKYLYYVRDVNSGDRQVSFAFRDALRSGVGYVEVADNPDPTKHPIMWKHARCIDIYPDPVGRNYDQSDYRDMFRSMIVYPAALAVRFAKFRDEIMDMPGYEGGINPLSHSGDYADRYQDDPPVGEWGQLQQLYNEAYSTGTGQKPKQVRVVERWYRQECRKKLVKFRNGMVVEPDPANDAQIRLLAQALIRGEAKLVWAVVPVMRVAVFLPTEEGEDALLLSDEPTPLPHALFPFVPVWAYEDENGQPMGIIDNWRTPQRDFNLRATHLLKRSLMQQVFYETTAFADIDQATNALAQMNGMIELNEGGIGRYAVRDNLSGSELELRMQQQNLSMLQEWSGMTAALLGQKTQETSGVAIQSKQQSGQTRLFTLFDNRDWAVEQIGIQTLLLMKNRLTEEETVRVTDSTKGVRFITLNEELPDGTIKNNVATAAIDIKIIPANSKATESMATLEAISNMLTQAPPEFAAIFMPAIAKLMPETEGFVDEVTAVKDAILARMTGIQPGQPGAPADPAAQAPPPGPEQLGPAAPGQADMLQGPSMIEQAA